MMKRTQIQVPDEDFRELEHLARSQGRSVAECVRQGIRLFLDRCHSNDLEIGKIAGAFRPRSIKDLKRHDQWVTRAIQDARSR